MICIINSIFFECLCGIWAHVVLGFWAARCSDMKTHHEESSQEYTSSASEFNLPHGHLTSLRGAPNLVEFGV